jgi:Tfp pilus assembly protein PilZ
VGHAYRVLGVTFASRADLEREYSENLAHGGLFIPGSFDLLYGEPVIVLVDLPFVSGAIELEGCVVQNVPPEFEENGGRSGVAVEIENSPEEIRLALDGELGDQLVPEVKETIEGRVAPRSKAEVRARVCVAGVSELMGRTRNLSLAGVLVGIDSDAPPVGAEVSVWILHPTSGEERSIPGVIVRHEIDASDRPTAVGIQFLVPECQAKETIAYLNRVKASEHARRLGGISGSINTLGVSDLLSSFGMCIPAGRFTLMRAGEVGTIQIQDGVMHSVQIGAAFGIKALVRMLAWNDGNFEFHAITEPDSSSSSSEWSMPIEVGLLEAARFLDENRRDVQAALPRDCGLRVEHRIIDVEDPSLSKIDQSILDLAGLGMTVARLIDTIQEPDRLVEDCILDLIERGAIRVDGDRDDDGGWR